tara:strand:+ start:2783 stop:3133 length:351 start_codon:yes stop_codon:yes gene_type:complete
MAARRKATRRRTKRKTTARRRTTKRKVARKRPVRRRTKRKSRPAKRAAPKRAPATAIQAVPTKRRKDTDLASMYLSILIVGVAGIILLFARPTQFMQKAIGVLLVILGLWGLMMKK